MNTAVITIKTDPEVKKKAQHVARELGLSLSAVINTYLSQLIVTKRIVISSPPEEPSEYLIRALKESEKDIKEGRVSPKFDNANDAIKWLDTKKKKYGDKK